MNDIMDYFEYRVGNKGEEYIFYDFYEDKYRLAVAKDVMTGLFWK